VGAPSSTSPASAALSASPGLSAYTASKHAVIGLTKSGGLEFATRKIRINAVAPGGTATEMFNSGTQQQRDFLASLSPMKRVSDPVEIAAAITSGGLAARRPTPQARPAGWPPGLLSRP
jgi:NAD(P)-dependent dehydrogenase (short-subunit alcohol dehydrogenase family)